jgi:hypothetical protein
LSISKDDYIAFSKYRQWAMDLVHISRGLS